MTGVLTSKPMKVTAYTPVDQWSMAYFRERMEAIHYTEYTSELLCLIKVDQVCSPTWSKRIFWLTSNLNWSTVTRGKMINHETAWSVLKCHDQSLSQRNVFSVGQCQTIGPIFFTSSLTYKSKVGLYQSIFLFKAIISYAISVNVKSTQLHMVQLNLKSVCRIVFFSAYKIWRPDGARI